MYLLFVGLFLTGAFVGSLVSYARHAIAIHSAMRDVTEYDNVTSLTAFKARKAGHPSSPPDDAA